MQSNNTSKPCTSWGNKPYHSLDYENKKQYGQKVYKLSLNAGLTCPNRDGTIDKRGCIFCSEGGSGDFAGSSLCSITEQIKSQQALLSSKVRSCLYIGYFQAFTNTYGQIATLKALYNEALAHKDIIGLSIATRPDCLSKEVLALLKECNQKKPITIELGLQTIHEKTATFIRRGYPLSCFADAVRKLNALQIHIVVHLIVGLPFETKEMFLASIDYLNSLPIQGIKLSMLHILKGTDLHTFYEHSPFPLLNQEEYMDYITCAIRRLRPDIVIHRMTGDGPKALLVAPLWTSNKKNVLNQLHHHFKITNSYQGMDYIP